MTKYLLQIAKYLWLILVFGGALLYLFINFDKVVHQVQIVGLPRLLATLLLLILGKLLLVELSRQSVEIIATKPLFSRMLYINSLSQLAKYLPGGIWHFVGRAGYYHSDGMTIKQATQAMVVENIWLITSAAFVGAIFFIFYVLEATYLPTILVLVASWWSILFIMTRWRAPNTTLQTTIITLLLQAVIWVLFGTTLWILIPRDTPGLFQLSVSAFSLSWVIGYLTLFAPSGLGVREGILVAILALTLNPADSVIYAAIHRMMWVISEIILGVAVRLNLSRQGVFLNKMVSKFDLN